MANAYKYKPTYNAKIVRLVNAGKVVRQIDIACELDIDKQTLYNWAAEFPEFRKTLDWANSRFERRLREKLEDGSISPIVGIFQLKCNHKAIEHSVERDLDRKDRELDARIKGEIKDGTSAELTVVFKDIEEA